MNRRRALHQLSSCLGGNIPKDADWRSILSLANAQLVTPTLNEGLNSNPKADQTIPEDVRAFLVEVHKRSRARNESLSRTLHDALGALNAAGIVPVLLKGCAMWANVRGAPGNIGTSRILCDLDLLVHPLEFGNAMKALSARGFVITEDHSRRTFHPIVEFARPIDAGSIDLHQYAPGLRGNHAIDDVRAHCSLVDVNGTRAMRPSPELQILTLVLHDQLLDGHYWRGGFHFRHLLDIAELTKREQEIDWQVLIRICPSPVTRRALKVQLLAARRFAGAKIPDWVVRGFWARLHFAHQSLFFLWPEVGVVFRKIGLSARVWRILSRMSVRRERKPATSMQIAFQDAHVVGLTSAGRCRVEAKDVR